MQPWVHKHAPKLTKDVVGNTEAIEQMKSYLAKFKPGQKPILLVGSPGIGKTSMVHALANELDMELLEVNASDSRNKEAIETIIGGASVQQSLFFKQKIILVDEVDGVSGQQDRGGIPALVAVVERSRFPIIFTANEASDKLKPLMKISNVIELSPLAHEHILERINHIAKHEKVVAENDQLSAIARRSGGDLRAAINDLQSLSFGEKITKEDVALLDEREAKEQVEAALLRIFKTTSADVALPAFDNVDEEPDTIMLWIDENLPREYKTPDDLARAFDALAEADKFFGRIRRWQYYRYYVYVYNLLSAGIAISKEKKYAGSQEYMRSGRILKMWIYNQKNAKRKKISQLLAPQLHTSAKRVRTDVLPFLKVIYQKDKKKGKEIISQYNIDEESAEFFEK